MRRLLAAASERLIAYVEALPDMPAGDVAGAADAARALTANPPAQPGELEEVLDRLFQGAVPKSFNAASPGYLAYIPGGGLVHAAVGELLAAAINRYTGVWPAAPALVELEANVLRWFCSLVGYGPDARGFLTSGGSLANFSALVTARRERLPEDFLRGTIYVSSEVHHSLDKAAILAGFPAANVRSLPADDRFRLDPQRLRAAIAADRAAGWQPFLVVASGGTVNTGAVDPLAAIADVAQDEGLWMHVDAAYGGFFLLTERGRAAFAGIERADSVTLDPHKGMFLPYGTGCLLAKDGGALRRAHSLHAAYLPAQPGEDWWDFSVLSPELSRPFRGLGPWLALELAGTDAFVAALDEKLDLARWAADEIARLPDVTLVAAPELSLLAFRADRPGWTRDERDRKNAEWMERTNARQRVMLTGTQLAATEGRDGGFVLRICVLHLRTHRERMEMALADLRSALAEILASE